MALFLRCGCLDGAQPEEVMEAKAKEAERPNLEHVASRRAAAQLLR